MADWNQHKNTDITPTGTSRTSVDPL